jgi:hypothetical protein
VKGADVRFPGIELSTLGLVALSELKWEKFQLQVLDLVEIYNFFLLFFH